MVMNYPYTERPVPNNSAGFSLIEVVLLVSHLIASYVGASVIGHALW